MKGLMSERLNDLINSGIGRVSPNDNGLYDCPVCKKSVTAGDFVTSYRFIEGSDGEYFVVNLCRSCRDSERGGV